MLKIVIDTREQKPYEFSVPGVKKKLDAGDYSIEGLESIVTIERKSMDDFILTIIHNRSRFYEELKRMKLYKYACVVVECSYREMATGKFNGKASIKSVLGTINSIIIDFRIPVYFLGDRPSSRAFVENLLTKIHAKEQGGHSEHNTEGQETR